MENIHSFSLQNTYLGIESRFDMGLESLPAVGFQEPGKAITIKIANERMPLGVPGILSLDKHLVYAINPADIERLISALQDLKDKL
jgi:hypothetical protein